MNQSMMLVSDLDGTLLGEPAALARFAAWLAEHRQRVVLAYATGRTSGDVRDLVERSVIPAPDFALAALGTELIRFTAWAADALWPPAAGVNWDVSVVFGVLSEIPQVSPQPVQFQTPFKASFFLEAARSAQLAKIQAALESAGVEGEVIYSGGRFLDILPKGVNKGSSARFLAEKLGISFTRVVACGDSGNDLSLFQQGFCGVIVQNALPELLAPEASSAYQSPYAFARGVLDGVQYWEQRWLACAEQPC